MQITPQVTQQDNAPTNKDQDLVTQERGEPGDQTNVEGVVGTHGANANNGDRDEKFSFWGPREHDPINGQLCYECGEPCKPLQFGTQVCCELCEGVYPKHHPFWCCVSCQIACCVECSLELLSEAMEILEGKGQKKAEGKRTK